MADAVTSQTIVDGEKTVVQKFTNISDGTGESAVVKVDVSGLAEVNLVKLVLHTLNHRKDMVAVHWHENQTIF